MDVQTSYCSGWTTAVLAERKVVFDMKIRRCSLKSPCHVGIHSVAQKGTVHNFDSLTILEPFVRQNYRYEA